MIWHNKYKYFKNSHNPVGVNGVKLPALRHLGCYAEHPTTDLVVCSNGNGCVCWNQYLCRFRNGRPSVAPHEMYTFIRHRAQRHAYWLYLGLYPVFAVIIMMTGFEWNTAFAVMGTLTSAAYLLLPTFYEWRMS